VRNDLDGQLIPFVDELLLASDVVDRLHRVADRGQLVLGLLPLSLLDELLHLGHLGLRSQRNLLVACRGGLTEQHGAQAVERGAWSGVVDDRPEPAET
jgi:hypothetical protein